MIISFVAPLSSSLACVILLIVRYYEKERYGLTKHNTLLILYFLALSLVCSLVLLNLYHISSNNKWGQIIFMFSSMYMVVIFYHIVHLIMSIQKKPRIAKIHYFIPLVIVLVFVCLFYRTAGVAFLSFLNIPSPSLHKIAFSTAYWIWLLYKVVYSLIILKQLFVYRKQIINYSAEQDRTSMNWLMWIIYINIVLIPLTISQLILDRSHAIILLLICTTNFMIMLQSVILFYNMFTNNYIIILSDNKKVNPEPAPLSLKINKESFEKYITGKKPYLNPELRITDMILPLGTNRTYLSKFINNTYGMSFSSYINNCRIKELKSYQSNPKMDMYTDEDLVVMAGFSNYRGYRRFVKEKGEGLHEAVSKVQ